MSEDTKVEWTDATLSPWIGCTQVSEGCAHCYVVRTPPARVHGVKLGAGQPRYRVKTFRAAAIALNRKAERLGRRLRVFPSLCDWLDPEVPVEWLAEFLDVIRLTPWLDWQLCTKRPERWASRLIEWHNSEVDEMYMCAPPNLALHQWVMVWLQDTPPANVWIGWTAENQARADERTPHGLAIPAVVRFVSVEPMLGPIDLKLTRNGHSLQRRIADDLHWVICGGESGPGARPMHPDWARSLRDQCAAAGVPFFFKQWGEWAPYDRGLLNPKDLACPDATQQLRRYGKKLAGRLLDGREHNEFPEVLS